MKEEKQRELIKLSIEYLHEYGLVPFLVLIGTECGRVMAMFDNYVKYFGEAVKKEEGQSESCPEKG
jgi:hypothetical protein